MRLKTWFWVLLFFLLILAILWYTVFNGMIGGFSVNDQFPGMIYTGSFYDIARGPGYLKDYDVFVEGKSMNYFDSALEACQVIYPGSKAIYESSVTGEKFSFISAESVIRTEYGYENFCYK